MEYLMLHVHVHEHKISIEILRFVFRDLLIYKHHLRWYVFKAYLTTSKLKTKKKH